MRIDQTWWWVATIWNFFKFIDALGQWVKRNSVTETGKEKPPTRRDKNFNTRQQNAKKRKCVFYNGTGHGTIDCTEVKDLVKRGQIVSSKKLCFNCLKSGHPKADYPSPTFNAVGSTNTIVRQQPTTRQLRQQRSRSKRKDDGFFWRKECLLPYCDRQRKWNPVLDPDWTLVLAVATRQQLWSVSLVPALPDEKRDK